MAVIFHLDVKDEMGQIFTWDNWPGIPVLGDTTVPPTFHVKLDKDSVSIGETVTAEFEITGPEEYHDIECNWRSRNNCNGGGSDWDFFATTKGTSSFAPKFGNTLELIISVKNKNDQEFSYTTDPIPVLGDLIPPPNMTFIFDKNQVALHDPISVQYTIDGPGKYHQISGQWYIYSESKRSSSWQGMTDDDFSNYTDKSTFIPKFGSKIEWDMWVHDENDQSFGFQSDTIPIVGISDSFPQNHRVIEGDNSLIYTPDRKGLVFRADGDYSSFRGIQVDDLPRHPENFSSWSGSTYVRLEPNFLDTLSNGTHSLAIIFEDGYAKTSFQVDREPLTLPELPQTGDHSPLLLWITLMANSVMIVLIVLRHTKKAVS